MFWTLFYMWVILKSHTHTQKAYQGFDSCHFSGEEGKEGCNIWKFQDLPCMLVFYLNPV